MAFHKILQHTGPKKWKCKACGKQGNLLDMEAADDCQPQRIGFEECPTCNGYGFDEDESEDCTDCDGSGIVTSATADEIRNTIKN